MPATTRSSNKQPRLDDSQDLKTSSKAQKRKADQSPAEPRPKKAKSTFDAKNNASKDSDIVIINRAPVLELWAASVTSFLHSELSWQACLSAGSAISTLCAISKGRAIGSIDKPDPDKAEQRNEARKRKATELDELEVMHFHLPFKNGVALVGGKPKKPNESALKHKFGDQFEATSRTFQSALETWTGAEGDLNGQAFHMYEKFRPSVPAGQKGWGRQGQLSLQKVTSVVKKT